MKLFDNCPDNAHCGPWRADIDARLCIHCGVQILEFTDRNLVQWGGNGDLLLISPDALHKILLLYTGEPPHGDSYHTIKIDDRLFPGFAWGCMFAMSPCSQYFAMSWMKKLYERHTVVVDLERKCYFVLPIYMYKFQFEWPSLVGTGESDAGKNYTFTDIEQWSPF